MCATGQNLRVGADQLFKVVPNLQGLPFEQRSRYFLDAAAGLTSADLRLAVAFWRSVTAVVVTS
jgi:hypothetical protein